MNHEIWEKGRILKIHDLCLMFFFLGSSETRLGRLMDPKKQNCIKREKEEKERKIATWMYLSIASIFGCCLLVSLISQSYGFIHDMSNNE